MVVNVVNPDTRKDLVITLEICGEYKDRLCVTVDRLQPPCGDYKQENYYVLDIAQELNEDALL